MAKTAVDNLFLKDGYALVTPSKPVTTGTFRAKGIRGVASTSTTDTISGTWYATSSHPTAVDDGSAVYAADTRGTVSLTSTTSPQQDARDFIGVTAIYFVPSASTGSPALNAILIPPGP